MLCDEKDLIALPDELSYEDGAQVACGFGTCYEALMKIGVSGNDRVLVTGLGPVGLATLMLAKAMGCDSTIGCDINEERLQLAKDLGLADVALNSSDIAACEKAIMDVTNGFGCERTIDCSASNAARAMAIRCTREGGKMAMVGEGNDVTFNPSPDIMHGQKSIYGSWVTSLWRMEELVEHLVRWKIHPDRLITHRFELKDADKAYALMASGKCGKVAIVFPD
jgi:threonine dehydrogenase-like Zn-dependent dehydrogenase